MKRGTRVEFDNPKNKKRHGKRGVITDMDRGNIWVKLDDGKTVCTRTSLLKEVGLLDKIAEAAKTITVTKSPHEEDYEDDNPPPWSYGEDGFLAWVDEVFFEGYKSDAPSEITLDQAIEHLRSLGYEVEVK